MDVTRSSWWITDWSTRETNIPLDEFGRPKVNIPYRGLKLFANMPIYTDLQLVDASMEFLLTLHGDIQVRLTNVENGYEDRYSCQKTLCRHRIRFKDKIRSATMSIESASAGADWHVYLPGFDEKSNLLHPEFVNNLKGFKSIRNLNWNRTNGSGLQNWRDRVLPEQRTQASKKGAAYEHFIDLANSIKSDPWITIPHLATDDYVRNLAQLLKARVAQGRQIYIEYSNEIWNLAGPFTQSRYAEEQGKALFPREPGDNDFNHSIRSRAKYLGFRSAQVFKIFQEVFSNKNISGPHTGASLVKVLAWQAAAKWSPPVLIAAFKAEAPQGVDADALAIAPYLHIHLNEYIQELQKEVLMATTGNVPDRIRSSALTNEQHDMVRRLIDKRLSVEFLLDQLMTVGMERTAAWVQYYRDLANQHGYDLHAYEGGQHLQPPTPHVVYYDNWVQMMYATNSHPRMKDVYLGYQQIWEENGGDMHAYLGYIQDPRRGAAFGAMKYLGDYDAPKWHALICIMFGCK